MDQPIAADGIEVDKIGAVSSYSNAGPLRRFADLKPDDFKPDLAAPGRFYTAPTAEAVDPKERDATGAYRLFYCTSASTPYTAGIIALMLQANPRMTRAEVRSRLIANLSCPAKSIKLPSPEWGHGKLDKAAVERMFETINNPLHKK